MSDHSPCFLCGSIGSVGAGIIDLVGFESYQISLVVL